MDTYLQKLKNKDGKYKRVCLSPLRYPGGNSKAVGIILEKIKEFSDDKTTIVSPFFGGGSVELCLSQELNFEVKGYDVFGMLTNFWDVLINQRDDFVRELEKFQITPEEFTYNRHVLLNYWEKIKPSDLNYKTKNRIELAEHDKTLLDNNKVLQACYYYYNMTLSYGPMFLGWPSAHEINRDKFKRRIEKMKKTNLKNLSVQESNFEQVLINHRDDFLFLDPPYYLEGDSKMFKGIYPNTNFAIHHNNFNHKLLCDLLKQHRGGFVMTYNDCNVIRDWYKEYHQDFPVWQYTYGQGETRRDQNVTESHELRSSSPPSSSGSRQN
jgi:DNA adenine methylase